MPTATEFSTVAISTVALGLSVYGVWDKRRDTRRQLRVRLSEVVDELATITLEQEKATRGPQAHPRLVSSFNAQREMLCREGIELTRLLKGDVTDGAYRVLAIALERIGDPRGAEELWQRGIAVAAPDSIFKAFVLRGYASHLFRRGQVDRGRLLFDEALSMIPDDDMGHLVKAETYLAWAELENGVGAAATELERIYDVAETLASSVKYRPLRERGLWFVAAAKSGQWNAPSQIRKRRAWYGPLRERARRLVASAKSAQRNGTPTRLR
jgi:tetratricopeptide (TPR) repeat protein